MLKAKSNVPVFALLLSIITVSVYAGEKERTIKTVLATSIASNTESDLVNAKVTVSGTSLRIQLSDSGKWLTRGWDGFMPRNMSVRYFDKDGNYLGHFTTEESFMPEWAVDFSVIKASDTFGSGSTFSYGVNARDISFIEIVEIAFSEEGLRKESKDDFIKVFESPYGLLSCKFLPEIVEYVELSPARKKISEKSKINDILNFGWGDSGKFGDESRISLSGKEIYVHLISGKILVYKEGDYSSGSDKKNALFFENDNETYFQQILGKMPSEKFN